MDIVAAYQQVGPYREAAAVCGTTHKTVRRVIEQAQSALADEPPPTRPARSRNDDGISDLVAERVETSTGKISAKRLLPGRRDRWLSRLRSQLPPTGRGPEETLS